MTSFLVRDDNIIPKKSSIGVSRLEPGHGEQTVQSKVAEKNKKKEHPSAVAMPLLKDHQKNCITVSGFQTLTSMA